MMFKRNAQMASTQASYIETDLVDSALSQTSNWSDHVEEVQLGDAKVTLSAADELPEWVREAVVKLNQIAAMPANWNSYGAPPINQRTLEHALFVLTKIMEPDWRLPRILATGRGGVEFGWYDRNRELEITVDAPLRGQFYFVDEETGEEYEAPLGIDYKSLMPYVERVAR